MNSKKFILAALAAFAVLFVLNSLWFGVIFKDWLANQMPEMHENIPLHVFAELVFAVLLAIIYPLGYKGGSPASEGLKFGLLMGLVYQLPNAIHMYASMGGSPAVPCMFIVNGILVGIAAGITIGLVYGNKGTSTQV